MEPDGRRIVAALAGKWAGVQGKARCLICNTNALVVTQRAGKPCLVHCFAGCDQWAVINALKDAGLWPDRSDREERHPSFPMALPHRSKADEEAEIERRINMARGIFKAALPSPGSPVEAYLRFRGIRLPPPPSLRFAPACWHSATGQQFPALIGAVQNGEGRITAIQRVYLKPDGAGKAPIEPPKAGLGPMFDGAVRLAKAGRVLGIAEGIETALAARQIFKVPTWAVLGCGRLGSIMLPEEVEHVVIFADQGTAGQEAAQKAAQAYGSRGMIVDIETPEGTASDWNDALRVAA